VGRGMTITQAHCGARRYTVSSLPGQIHWLDTKLLGGAWLREVGEINFQALMLLGPALGRAAPTLPCPCARKGREALEGTDPLPQGGTSGSAVGGVGHTSPGSGEL
jgi:hypothetical protein